VVKKLAVVVIGFKALLQSGPPLNPGIDVAIVQLFVQDQKGLIIIHKGKNFLSIWPRRSFKVLICQLGPPEW